MGTYRKKPVVVEAWQWTPPQWADMPQWLLDAIENGTCCCHQHGEAANMVVTINTLNGMVTAPPGEWIIKGVEGEIYPCKPDIFAATYEPAELERLPDVEAMPPGARADAMRHDPNWRAQPIEDQPRQPLAELIDEGDYHHPNQRATRFRDEIEQVINSHSRENGSGTPDFILAQFVLDVMDAFDSAVTRRQGWYGRPTDEKALIKMLNTQLQTESAMVKMLKAQINAEGEHTAAGQAEIERLNTAIRLRDDQLSAKPDIGPIVAEIERLQAENAQLRGQLQQVSMAGLAPSMVIGK